MILNHFHRLTARSAAWLNARRRRKRQTSTTKTRQMAGFCLHNPVHFNILSAVSYLTWLLVQAPPWEQVLQLEVLEQQGEEHKPGHNHIHKDDHNGHRSYGCPNG